MLDWRGEEVSRKIIAATKWGIDKVLSECVVQAKKNWIRAPRGTPPGPPGGFPTVRTSALQGSIEMRPARETSDAIIGLWGSFDIDYAIYVETGTGKMGARPYLRPAADQHYPKLAGYIKRRVA